MAQTAAQIVSLSCAIAKTPGMIVQAGQLLNVVLQELCQTYDFDVAKKTVFGTFNTSLVALLGDSVYGSGPYPLPADYLRAEIGDVFWTLPNTGVKYPLIPIDLAEFDVAVQQAGLQNYPSFFCTDMSPNDAVQQGDTSGAPTFYIYMPPSGNYPYTIRYRSQMPDIATPESSTTVPWFPNQNYLITRLAGELMKISDDERAPRFLGEGPDGAQGILDRYLKLKDDKSNRSQSVKLDRRQFGPSFSNLPNTKLVGW